MSTLTEMENRAKRHLDGMTVNKDVMARDVLTLVNAIRKASETKPETKQEAKFGDIFKDIFG